MAIAAVAMGDWYLLTVSILQFLPEAWLEPVWVLCGSTAIPPLFSWETRGFGTRHRFGHNSYLDANTVPFGDCRLRL